MGAVTPIADATESAPKLRGALRGARTALLWAAAARFAFGIIAVPLAAVLYDHHFVWVVFLRPTKEVLLAAGFLIRRGDVGLPAVLLASVPLVVGGSWLMYALGVVYRKDLREADLPGPAGRLLPPDRIKRLSSSLERDGVRVIFLGRLAIFPSSLMSAAAGASNVPPRTFALADGLGALASIGQVILAGFLLGEAYEKAGPWLTAIGAVALLVLLFLVGRRLRRDG